MNLFKYAFIFAFAMPGFGAVLDCPLSGTADQLTVACNIGTVEFRLDSMLENHDIDYLNSVDLNALSDITYSISTFPSYYGLTSSIVFRNIYPPYDAGGIVQWVTRLTMTNNGQLPVQVYSPDPPHPDLRRPVDEAEGHGGTGGYPGQTGSGILHFEGAQRQATYAVIEITEFGAPEPASMLLTAAGLLAIGALGARRVRSR